MKELRMLPVESVRPNKWNVNVVTDAEYAKLKEAMRASGPEKTAPITVRRAEDGAESVEGAYKKQRRRFEKVKRSMENMVWAGLFKKKLWVIDGKAVANYTLTPMGRSIAAALKYEKMDEEEKGKLLEEALEKLRDKRLKEGSLHLPHMRRPTKSSTNCFR